MSANIQGWPSPTRRGVKGKSLPPKAARAEVYGLVPHATFGFFVYRNWSPVGTGGWCTPDGIQAIVALVSNPLDTETEPDTAARVDAFPLREQITYARHYLSLSVADFARLVRVERPAVYAWMDGENEPRAANQEQLNRLYRAALYVKERFGEPVGSLLRVTTSELRLPLFELLSADADEIHVKQAIDVLATLPRQHTRKKSLTERSDESLARGRMRALSMAGRRTK